ncbi:DUF3967 domain-containing protein [Bacillus wiedmannii]|uniref:DUF3967 domain-containing protein n=1 Tax=Bacillus wiedmannii TaxID=1890302 RepID=UPI000BF0720F|nr:DUF3967 domain-containing protein [Bacillus wiedmannii]PEJ65822.1 hypothetical protein CN685_23310 [Bacillus wiedmannii]
MSDNKRIYVPKDIALLLEVKESTLRKYFQTLETHGYIFLKNDRGHRAFFDKDVVTLRQYVDLVQKNKMSMDSAAKVVLAMDSSNDLSHCNNDNTKKLLITNDKDVTITNDNDHDKDYVTKEELCDIIKGLTKTIQQQNEYLNKRLEERDRTLMSTLREIQDTKKQIAVSSEQQNKIWQWLRRMFGEK